jgi:hypothetical protein
MMGENGFIIPTVRNNKDFMDLPIHGLEEREFVVNQIGFR